MSISSISKASFHLEPIKEDSYTLRIEFLQETDAVVSQKDFIFSLGEEGKNTDHAAFENELFDVYSQNGICDPEILETLFTKTDVQEIRRAIRLLKTFKFQGPTILVLDLKVPEAGYREDPEGTIAKSEKVICDFLKNRTLSSEVTKHARHFHKALTPDFILCEGSLKKDILRYGEFSPAEVDYFHTSAGLKTLCQYTEFFMNAFKMGKTAQGQSGTLSAHQYIKPMSDKSFRPCVKSTVFYPPTYKEMYSLEGAFMNVLENAYSVEGEHHHDLQITRISVTRK